MDCLLFGLIIGTLAGFIAGFIRSRHASLDQLHQAILDILKEHRYQNDGWVAEPLLGALLEDNRFQFTAEQLRIALDQLVDAELISCRPISPATDEPVCEYKQNKPRFWDTITETVKIKQPPALMPVS